MLLCRWTSLRSPHVGVGTRMAWHGRVTPEATLCVGFGLDVNVDLDADVAKVDEME